MTKKTDIYTRKRHHHQANVPRKVKKNFHYTEMKKEYTQTHRNTYKTHIMTIELEIKSEN